MKQHGRNFQLKVVLHGPSDRFIATHIFVERTPIQDRVHFRGSEWRDFLHENGFKVGHELIFSLVANSIFLVRHSGAVNANIQKSVDRIEKSEICHDTKEANLQESNVEPSERLVEVPQKIDSRVPYSSGLKSPVTIATTIKPWASYGKNDVVYARNTSAPELCQTVNMLVGKSQCPHFVMRINKSHLREWKSSSLVSSHRDTLIWFAMRLSLCMFVCLRTKDYELLEKQKDSIMPSVVCEFFHLRCVDVQQSVPHEFYKKYATYFSDGANIFQGPNGLCMNLRFSVNSSRFTSGWKAFHKENDIKLGDVMLFSLCEPARWLIQFVDRKLEEVSMESECGSSS